MFETKFFSATQAGREAIDEWLNSRQKSFDVVGYAAETTGDADSSWIWITIKFK